MKSRKKKTVIVNRKRFTAFITLVVILTFCGFSSVSNHVFGSNGDVIIVSVASGDTLWDIARENNPNEKNIRELVYEIKKYNNLKSNTIYAGDEIIVPL